MRQDGYRPRRPFKSRTSVNREAARDRPIVAADHCDAAKAYDPIVMTESGGLDITKRHRRRQVIQPHVPSSPSWGCGATATAITETPRRPGGADGEREPIRVRSSSVHAPLCSRKKPSTKSSAL